MNYNLKQLCFSATLFLALLFSTNATAQATACCAKGKTAEAKTACCSSSSKAQAGSTSGCSPSACRGAKTKFGEAKVISDLRLSLIDLKTDMEKSTRPKFDAASYDIHGIVGESDEESLAILVKEVQLVEMAFAEKLNHQARAFVLPDSKAKQVKYLNTRIAQLKGLL